MVADCLHSEYTSAGLSLLTIVQSVGESVAAPLRNLIKEGYIEEKAEDGMANADVYVVSRQIINTYLSKFRVKGAFCCKKHNDISAKQLFYNDSESRSLERLTSLLKQDKLSGVFHRLDESGMRKGVACLFYGAPGTGKTESVYQIARKTGRDLMELDISNIRDKYVGETEKTIKRFFVSYRTLCNGSEVMPILFINEADAIFCRRSENTERAVDKMENAMQNIILQELESLEGILIATTNLTSNFDKAFERRFLFKIEFHKPDLGVRNKIWRSMLKDYSHEDCMDLASKYDFSGGQIENISRKITVEYVLNGQRPSVDTIKQFCREEEFGNKAKRIGFNIL